MRNKLLIIVIAIFSFFIADKVSAESKPVTHTLTDKAREFFSNTDNFPDDVLPNVVLYSNGADSYSTNDNYFILTSFDSSIYSIKYKTDTLNSRQKFLVLMLHDIENNIYNETSSYNGFNGYSNYVKNYKLYYDDETDEYSWGTAGSGGMWIKGYDNRNIYYSNFDIFYYENDEVFFSKNLEYSNSPSYKFDDIIHDDNIAQTYFNLNMEQLQKNGYNLNLKYAYGNYTNDILAPFLKITYDDNTNSYISIVSDDKPILTLYMGEFEMCLDNSKTISNVQLIFPMENTKDTDYKIQLESNVKFNISYVYDEVFSSNLTTVDITGKYSVMLIPRLVEYNSEAFQDFYLTGDNYEIRILNHIDTSDISSALNYIYRNWNRPTFRYFEGVNQVTNAIQFINNDYVDIPDKQYTVTFDNRYWTYYIADKYNSIVTVTNPNTGITNDVNFEDITNNIANDIYGDDLSDYLDYINDRFKDNSEDSANKFFSNLLVIIYDSAPGRLTIMFRLFLILTFIGCLVYVMGWK